MKNLFVKHILLAAFVSLFSFTSCNNEKKQSEITEKESAHKHEEEDTMVELSEAQYKNAKIELGKIQQKSLSDVLSVNGIMDTPPQNLVSISTPLGGFVAETELLVGMKIKKGQLLVTLEHPDYVQLQQDYIDKKGQLEYLQLEFKRQEELNNEEVSSAKVFQKSKSDFISMKAQVKGLQEKLQMIGINTSELNENTISRKVNIYAPINGYVSAVNVNIGKYVKPTDVMFEIVNTEHLHAELTVYEKDLSKIKIGQKIRLILPNQNDNERVASIFLIGRKIDADRSVRVHAHLKNEDNTLFPGMYINALIELNDNKVNAVPNEAVVMAEGKSFIFSLKGKHFENDNINYEFEMLEVVKGISQNGFTEISFVKTLSPDSIQLVTKGAFALLAKMKNAEEEGGGHHH